MAVLKDTIIIKDLAKTFYLKSETKEVLKDINITVKENEFLVLLGPGQCGKTVLLNILAGLDAPTGGEITFVNGRPPDGRPGGGLPAVRPLPLENGHGERGDQPEVQGQIQGGAAGGRAEIHRARRAAGV